jgi:hypothetical protein
MVILLAEPVGTTPAAAVREDSVPDELVLPASGSARDERAQEWSR